jgi:hypothetical protein
LRYLLITLATIFTADSALVELGDVGNPDKPAEEERQLDEGGRRPKRDVSDAFFFIRLIKSNEYP